MLTTLRHISILATILIICIFAPWLIFVVLLLVVVKRNKSRPIYQDPTTITEPILEDWYTPSVDVQTKQAYLKSPQWHIKRKATLKRDSYTCQSCGIDSVPLDVHHITYECLYAEKPEHLVSLCRDCHNDVHNRLGYDYNDTFPIKGLT